MKKNRIPAQPRPTSLAAAAALLAAAPAWAGSATLGDEFSVDYSLTATYSLARRMSAPADALVNGPVSPATGLPSTVNADDGDRNFSKGALIANRLSLLGELDIKRRNLGVFLRATGFYDAAYHGMNDNDSPATVNKSGANNAFTDEARHYMGQRARMLDAYAYGKFELGEESSLDLRIGRQVVQWGESLFFPNIAAAQGPVDATKATVPGIEVKDILLPVGQVSTSLRVNKVLSLMAYAQWEYKPNELNPVGSYFSYADVVGPGAQYLAIAQGFNAMRGDDIKPRNSGQWGLGARLRVGTETELGLYHLRYHDKNPSVVTNFVMVPNPDPSTAAAAPYIPAPTGYNIAYLADVKLTGASIATKLGDFSIGGEITQRSNQPVLVNTALGPIASRARATQAQVNFIYSDGPSWLADSTTYVGELVYLSVGGVQGATLVAAGIPAYGTPTVPFASTGLNATKTASAAQFTVSPGYNNVFNGWDLSVPITYAQQFSGISAVPGALGSLTGKGDKRLSIGATFKYLSNLELGLSYSAYLGSPDPTYRTLADRDNLAFSAKYTF
ncbi:DUF1302 domain-containing protein [Pelomonas sp. KK5]|uniref:DUF1302 domain-containing protein n=1 Tax=Pelomonas sp. KK5 TaxID=1855730 RepID=UPI00097BE4A2|nr:DUF1302 domain-containing protein [Pelomonas sp. KK5]